MEMGILFQKNYQIFLIFSLRNSQLCANILSRIIVVKSMVTILFQHRMFYSTK